MEQNLPEKTILELNQAPEINLFTHHSLPLLIPVSEDFDYWKLCNFINIFYHYDFPTSFDYTDYKRYYAGLFDISCLEYGDLEDIDRESFWKRQLCKEKYIYLWLNQKYLPGSFSYRKKDDLHPVLLYAYDAERFFAKAFDVDNAVYGLDFSARELEEAFCKTQAESGQNINDDDMILLFKREKFFQLLISGTGISCTLPFTGNYPTIISGREASRIGTIFSRKTNLIPADIRSCTALK